jgi:hypothetical protein
MTETTRSADRLFDLLPAIYRKRDAERGYPLRALLQVIAEQVDVVEDDVNQLYENWFIETCEDWAVPYLGDLVGYQPAHQAGQPGDVTTPRQRALNKILIPRRDVAHTIRNRRRKGTLALLELLAHDVAGWPARAVEFYRLLAWTQPLNHQRLERGRTADLRDGDALDLLDGPFDVIAHTVDVRRPNSHRTPGQHNIPSVVLFVWRLKAYSITKAPAYCVENAGPHCFTFSVLGSDAPLFTKPAAEPSPEHIAGPLNVPAPIRRRALERNLDAYYGPDSSFAIWAEDWPGYRDGAVLPADSIVVADLTDWQYRPPPNHVAVDPVLGRLAFPPRQLPKQNVWVHYHYGFSDDLGGGEYRRTVAQPEDATIYRVGEGEDYTRIGDALARWRDEAPRHAVIEIQDGGVYTEQITVELAPGQTLQLRAANRKRPVLRLMDWYTARPDSLAVRGEMGSRFTLDGLLVTGRGVQCEGPIAAVTLRHCTLVPGWAIGTDCKPSRPAEPSIQLSDTQAEVTIERSIVGSIQVSQDGVATDPISIRILDSILDATNNNREALGAPGWPLAHAVLTCERVTVFGEIHTHAIRLAENSIFGGKVTVARRQLGCMRFCSLPPGSRTPRRYRCQPDLAEQEAKEAIPKPDTASAAMVESVVERARTRVRPRFASTRYGTPAYAQLAIDCPAEITRGADDESEMGAFHDLFQPQRAANLQARLDEFVPAGMNAGISYAT